ncbi:putative protein N(5)-glutamine methyltransferase [Actinomadura darangshiensis]|uniref:peptide chain release factor N(5)-glutamine methyltransferase n=1 Tax=Actinomadura darangshiensis TaxID=705336 RepID=A0A4R5BCL4_9ACTN|nr:putative protein N(5)-glutamine methyltransferase [Actinomadura darangshiensis]TDD81262.1 putative protein N(5)-glutamine methyltransferase [Actinomadura darangshiensis]
MSEPLTASVVSRLRAAGCVFAEDEARLILSTAGDDGDVSAMVERRAAGEPLEHVLGWAEFRGLRIAVEPGVFVPRRRTEFLVRRAAALAPPRPVVLDLCCGSGALGAALVSGLDEFALHAADIEPASVRCARRNIAPFGGLAYEGDLFEPLPDALRGRVDVLLCNVPYVPTGDVGLMPAEARDHEPLVALDGGPDGLDVLRRVTAEAPRWLAPGGHLLFETSERQVPDAVAAVDAGGLAAAVATSEEFYATVIVGTKSV